VFAGTLRENLLYLTRATSDGQLDTAIQAFGLDSVIERCGGLDTRLPPGGGGLSAGERQLIALARVFLSPARLIILDEATCHLDPLTEARAERAIAARGSTLVVIAHRLSSALRARRVLLLDGTRAQLGTHDELLAASPLYADLFGHWSGLRGAA
jgi:ATP-binding cassette subfamily C protein